MSRIIETNHSLRPGLIRLLQKEKQRLSERLDAIERLLKECSNLIEDVTLSDGCAYEELTKHICSAEIQQRYADYAEQLSTREKILIVIERESRFLHVREIARIIQILESGPALVFILKKISPALSILKKNTDSPLVYCRVFGSHFNTFWGLKDWMDEEGHIKAEHLYLESQLSFFEKPGV